MTSPEIETAQAILRGDLSGIVRPLEWQEQRPHEWSARSLCGLYAIGKDEAEKQSRGWQWGLVGDPREWVVSDFLSTLDEAKAAAQADYAQRIASTLGPAIIALAKAFLDLHETRFWWKLVPVEPTAEMRLAGGRAHYHHEYRQSFRADIASDIYAAMLDAAPKTEDRT